MYESSIQFVHKSNLPNLRCLEFNCRNNGNLSIIGSILKQCPLLLAFRFIGVETSQLSSILSTNSNSSNSVDSTQHTHINIPTDEAAQQEKNFESKHLIVFKFPASIRFIHLERLLIRQNEHRRHNYSLSTSFDLSTVQSRTTATFSNVSSGLGAGADSDDNTSGVNGINDEKTNDISKLAIDISNCHHIISFGMFCCYNSVLPEQIVWPKYGFRNPSGVIQCFFYFSNDDYNHSKWDRFIQRQRNLVNPLKYIEKKGKHSRRGHQSQQFDDNYSQRSRLSKKGNTFEFRSNENTMKSMIQKISYKNLIPIRFFAFGSSIEIRSYNDCEVSLQIDNKHTRATSFGMQAKFRDLIPWMDMIHNYKNKLYVKYLRIKREQQEAYDTDNQSIVDAEQVINKSSSSRIKTQKSYASGDSIRNYNGNYNYSGNPPSVVGNNGIGYGDSHMHTIRNVYHTLWWNALNEFNDIFDRMYELLLVEQKINHYFKCFKVEYSEKNDDLHPTRKYTIKDDTHFIQNGINDMNLMMNEWFVFKHHDSTSSSVSGNNKNAHNSNFVDAFGALQKAFGTVQKVKPSGSVNC